MRAELSGRGLRDRAESTLAMGTSLDAISLARPVGFRDLGRILEYVP